MTNTQVKRDGNKVTTTMTTAVSQKVQSRTSGGAGSQARTGSGRPGSGKGVAPNRANINNNNNGTASTNNT